MIAAASLATANFQSRWNGLDAAAAPSAGGRFPSHCDLAVVGAGWGGAYLAWRLSVDTQTVNASSVCVFEANGRVGGRIFSVHDLPHFGDLAVDVGGYRFQETQKLPADLVFSALKLPTTCYDYGCQGGCEGSQNCYVIKDSYGNNAGYATPIERMLGEVEDAGAGTQVYFGARLTGIFGAPAAGAHSTRLSLASGANVTATKVLLNLPGNALAGLSKGSVVFEQPKSKRLLNDVWTFGMVKVYAWYDDAWWSTKLGMMEGYFGTGNASVTAANFSTSALSAGSAAGSAAAPNGKAPLLGRYHDGPQRCLVGHDTAGQPVYSGNKVKFGNCSGALEVYYGSAAKYYSALMTSPLQPLTVAVEEDGTAASKTLISDVHASLMAKHALAFVEKEIDPASVPPPKAVVLANWIADGEYTPGIGRLSTSPLPGKADQQRASVRKPAADFDVFVADQDYGYETGWAVGSLIMAEKVLQTEFNLPKPSWLDAKWYKANVLAHA